MGQKTPTKLATEKAFPSMYSSQTTVKLNTQACSVIVLWQKHHTQITCAPGFSVYVYLASFPGFPSHPTPLWFCGLKLKRDLGTGLRMYYLLTVPATCSVRLPNLLVYIVMKPALVRDWGWFYIAHTSLDFFQTLVACPLTIDTILPNYPMGNIVSMHWHTSSDATPGWTCLDSTSASLTASMTFCFLFLRYLPLTCF